MTSPAPSATTCALRIRPVPASATSLTTPQVSQATTARGTATTRQSHGTPRATNSASVSPPGRDRRAGEDDPGQRGVIRRPPGAGEALAAAADPLGGGDIDELRAAGHVPGRPDPRVGGPLLLIGGHLAAHAGLHPHRVQVQPAVAGRRPAVTRTCPYASSLSRSPAANPHLLVNQSTAGGTGPVSRGYIQAAVRQLGITVHNLRAGGLHAEAEASGGDLLRLTRLFGISDPTAIRYCAEPDLIAPHGAAGHASRPRGLGGKPGQ
jgi:hypothetical protein